MKSAIPFVTGLIVVLSTTLCPGLDYSRLIATVNADQASRYTVFQDFQIKGVCGDRFLELARHYGVNTLRSHTVCAADGSARALLDQADKAGLKVILGLWPAQSEGAGLDFQSEGDAIYDRATQTIDSLSGHPAILMWDLGRGMPIESGYLKVVQRISNYIHQRFPHTLTSLTLATIAENPIKAIKAQVPDLDVIGLNCYSPGSVRSAIETLEAHWGRPYYFAETGPRGPEQGGQTGWGERFEMTAGQKVAAMRQIFEDINGAAYCLGSAFYAWDTLCGPRITWMSLLLNPNAPHEPLADGETPLMTPQADELAKYASGNYPARRAPVLTRLQINGKANADIVLKAGESFTASILGEDPDDTELTCTWWIYRNGSDPAQFDLVAGPVTLPAAAGPQETPMTAPQERGAGYFLLGQVRDASGGASAATLPFMVE